MAPLVNPDDPYAQILFAVVVLAVYGNLGARYWPWKCDELNTIENVATMSLCLFLGVAGYFAEHTRNQTTYTVLMVCFLLIIALSILVVLLMAMSGAVRHGLFRRFSEKYDVKAKSDIATLMLKLSGQLVRLHHDALLMLLELMSDYDISALEEALDAVNAIDTDLLGLTRDIPNKRISNLPNKYRRTDSELRVTRELMEIEKTLSTESSVRRDEEESFHSQCPRIPQTHDESHQSLSSHLRIDQADQSLSAEGLVQRGKEEITTLDTYEPNPGPDSGALVDL